MWGSGGFVRIYGHMIHTDGQPTPLSQSGASTGIVERVIDTVVDKQFASVNNVPPEPWTGQDTRDRGMRCLIALELLRFSGRFMAWVSCSFLTGLLEVDRRLVTQALVTAVRIIPPLDIREYFPLCVAMVVEPCSVEQLTFQGGEEALRHGVVEAVTDRAHR